jgi:bifunctional UDP-N-acetylglucosamine pyrophosphorylase/glucosamine-1-phosphate N-acetyltransferase
MTSAWPISIDAGNWRSFAAPAVRPELWTAVVAAAGKGTRLNFDRPKILYPVAGRMILEWLLDLLLPCCETLVLVLSPAGRREIEPELERLAPGRFRIVVQQDPTGMGDAVEIGAGAVMTPHCALLWGDQVAVRPSSVDAVLRLHQGPLAPDATIPVVLRRDPYIHFTRDAAGNVSGVLQKREGDTMPAEGESDTGFFCFRTAELRRLLRDLRPMPQARGRATGEFNLLPVIPLAAQTSRRVLTPHLLAVEETVGINSAEDAMLVEPFLRSLHD